MFHRSWNMWQNILKKYVFFHFLVSAFCYYLLWCFCIIWYIWSQIIVLLLDSPFGNICICYKSSFLQPLNHCQAETLINSKDTEMPINSFVISRADYCNSLFLGLSAHAVKKLQQTHYAAMRILLKWDYLNVLHWLLNFKGIWIYVENIHMNYKMYVGDLRALPVWAYHMSNHFVLIFPVDHPFYWAVLMKSIKICTSSRE